MNHLLSFIVIFLTTFQIVSSQVSNRKIDSLYDISIELCRNQTDKAAVMMDSILVLSKEEKNSYGISQFDLAQGVLLRMQGRNEKVVELLSSYISKVDTSQYNNLGRAHLNLSQVYQSMDETELSIKNAELAARTFEKNSDPKARIILGVAYNQIAINNRKIKQYDQARLYYQKGIDLIESTDDNREASGIYANIGNTYGWEKDYERAEEYYKIALRMDSTYNNSEGMFYNYENMGNLYGRKGDFEKAMDYFKKSMTYIEGSNKIEELSIGNQRLGQIYMMTKKFDYALPYFKKALEYANSANMREAIRSLRKNIATCYAAKSDYKTAFNEMVSRSSISDSLYGEIVTEKIAEATTKFETAEKEKEIERLKYEEEISSLRIGRQRMLIALGSMAIGGLGGLLFFVFKQKNQIGQQNQIIAKALLEKETLLREIHHRVKNNLQFISSLLGLQTEHISDQVALDALQEGQDRVQSMALIHQNLYQEDNLTGVDMKEYFIKLIRGLFDSYNIRKDQVTLTLDIQDLNLDVDSVIPIGLVVNELVSNALKYAFPEKRKGIINVSLSEIDQSLVLSVKDDGIGITNDQQEKLGSSFGYRLINVFRDQLKAELNISGEDGTLVTMVIKNYTIAEKF